MPTEENPEETALIVRWSLNTFVLPLSPPPVGTQAIDTDGNVWRLFDYIPAPAAKEGETEKRLTWCALLEVREKPYASYLDNDTEREKVRKLRIIHTPNSPAAQES